MSHVLFDPYFSTSFFSYFVEKLWYRPYTTHKPALEVCRSGPCTLETPHCAFSFPSSPTSQSRFAVSTQDFKIFCSNGSCLIPRHAYTMSLGLSFQRQTLPSVYKFLGLRGGQGTTVSKDCGQSFCTIQGWPHGCLQDSAWQLRDLGVDRECFHSAQAPMGLNMELRALKE